MRNDISDEMIDDIRESYHLFILTVDKYDMVKGALAGSPQYLAEAMLQMSKQDDFIHELIMIIRHHSFLTELPDSSMN